MKILEISERKREKVVEEIAKIFKEKDNKWLKMQQKINSRINEGRIKYFAFPKML